MDAKSVSQEIEGVVEVTRVRTRDQGNNSYADIIVTVNADFSLLQSHEIADEIEALVAKKYNIQDAVVHIEPHGEHPNVK